MANTIDYRSDNLLELLGPVDRTTGLPVPATATGAVVLYDLSKDTNVVDLVARLNVAVVATDTVMPVIDGTGFESTDEIRMILDNGTVHSTTVSSATATTITLSAAIPASRSAAIGTEIRRWRIGDSGANIYVSVNDTEGWAIGDVCVLDTDVSGTYSVAEVDQVTDRFLILSAGPTQKVRSGNRVSSKFMTNTIFTLATFGTPFPTLAALTVEGDPAWGWRADLPPTVFDVYSPGLAGNAGLRLGDRVRAEYTLTTLGGDVLHRTSIATVVNL